MLRKIDIGTDKNLFVVDPKVAKKPQLKFLADDIPKSPDEAITEARKSVWGNWINSEPLLLGHVDENGQAYMFFISDLVRKKVMLLEIWDYTLLPSRRSLSYSLEWNRRYGHSGLLIIGIHTPMFEFGKDKKHVQDAVRELGIPFPVVCDNDYAIWKSLENRYWPRRLLLDSNGKCHLDTVGEGRYDDFERTIQLLLREVSPGLPCPPVLKPLRRIDEAGYSIPDTTHEIFFGTQKSPKLGNTQSFRSDGEETVFKDHTGGDFTPDLPYLEGGWLATAESIYGTPHRGDIRLSIKFTGTDVYIVARARSKNPLDVPLGTKVQIMIDNKHLTEDKVAGTDASINELRRSTVILRDPKLYHIATRLDSANAHELTLFIEEDPMQTIELYGLFFEHSA